MYWTKKETSVKPLSGFRSALAISLLGVASISLTSTVNAANIPARGSLEDKVRHQLVMLPYYGVFDNLSYRVENGRVTLFGEVTRPVLKHDAESAVKHLEGVETVDNQIEVLPLSPYDDRIRRATYFAVYGFGPLERYGMGTQPSIKILVKNGNVTLSGVVANKTDRNLAFVRANQVPGVFSVSNDLTVERE